MKARDKVKVGVVAAVCLMGLVVALKNVLHISPDIISRDMIIYIIVYFGFITALNFTEETPGEPASPKKTRDSPWTWSLLVILITLAIVAVYALG
ncbi:MAG TPA: hypothetical protein VKO45_06295 [Methanomicrobiales archaeon]|nr:hypothetical protein [Methanomicrobiales archaeon]